MKITLSISTFSGNSFLIYTGDVNDGKRGLDLLDVDYINGVEVYRKTTSNRLKRWVL